MSNEARTKTELSELALDAAIELELGGDPADDTGATQIFLKILSSQITNYDGSVFLKDESLVPIYSYALSNERPQQYVDRKDMLTRLSDLAKSELYGSEPNDALRRFFLGIHEALSTDLIDEHTKTVVNEQFR